MTDGPSIELSRPVGVVDLRGRRSLDIVAGPDERAALARRFGTEAVGMLEASLTLVVKTDGLIHLKGRLEAEVTQSCVVTLAPVVNRISAAIDRLYGDVVEEAELAAEEVISCEGDDPPDPIIDGVIDVGEVVAEQLGLEIDPFPRAAGVEFEGFSTGGKTPGPFDSLAEIKGKVSRK